MRTITVYACDVLGTDHVRARSKFQLKWVFTTAPGKKFSPRRNVRLQILLTPLTVHRALVAAAAVSEAAMLAVLGCVPSGSCRSRAGTGGSGLCVFNYHERI